MKLILKIKMTYDEVANIKLRVCRICCLQNDDTYLYLFMNCLLSMTVFLDDDNLWSQRDISFLKQLQGDKKCHTKYKNMNVTLRYKEKY